MRVPFLPLAFLGLLLSPTTQVVAQQRGEETPPSYMGRVIAQTMSYHGAPWLIRDERGREERTDIVMKQLQLKPGMAVCDLGCGNGYYTLRMARQVAPGGAIYAVDIQPEMLRLLDARARKQNIDNIKPILGAIDDARLPEDTIDLVLLVDVYHEFSHPEEMLQSIRKALKPDGVIALLEYRGEDPTVPIKPLHKMTKKQILKEYRANGFRVVRQFEQLPWQHLMFFGRDESWTGHDDGEAVPSE